MFNLYQILTGAQGGRALDNLAERFGLSRQQTDTAVQALIPAISTAFMTKAMHPGGMQEIAGAMTDDDHKQAYASPEAALAPPAQQKGDDIAASMFGNAGMIETVVREAARITGLSEDTLRGMLPVVISMVVGGAATAMHNQGMGSWLSQLANSGLGNIFGGAPGGGMFGSILGNIFGGGGQPTHPQAAAGADAPSPGAAPGGFPGMPGAGGAGFPGMPPAMQAGMEAFGKMFQPGVRTPGPLGGNLAEEISSILSGKRG